MKRTYLRSAVSALVVFGLVGQATAAATIVYREVFPYVAEPTQFDSTINATAGTAGEDRANRLIQQGWYGGNRGDNFATVGVNNTPGASNGAGEGTVETVGTSTNNNEPGAVASMPDPNDDPATGRAFQSQTAILSLFLYTDEFSIDSSLVTHVGWQSRNSRNSESGLQASDGDTLSNKWFDQGTIEGVDSHIAFRVDTGLSKYWYVSTEGFLQSGDASAWRDNGAFIDPLEWLVFGDGPLDGSTLPDTDFSSILLDLPVVVDE